MEFIFNLTSEPKKKKTNPSLDINQREAILLTFDNFDMRDAPKVKPLSYFNRN